MMFWGYIILKYPRLIHKLPKNVIVLNWGYEADHAFEREAALFAKAKIPFYICPGAVDVRIRSSASTTTRSPTCAPPPKRAKSLVQPAF